MQTTKKVIQKQEEISSYSKNKQNRQINNRLIDNRLEASRQRYFQTLANVSPQANQLSAIQKMVNNSQGTIQRQIDPTEQDPSNEIEQYHPEIERPKGSKLIGNYVRSNDGDMGIIMDYHSKTNVYEVIKQGVGETFNEEDQIFVVGTDPYWRVISDESWKTLSLIGRRSRPKAMISLKTDHLQEKNIIDYRLDNNTMLDSDDLPLFPVKKKVSFVITQNIELIIGDGHTGLSGGNAVILAGMMEIENGKAKYVGNESGHYFPQGLEEVRGIKYMMRHFPWVRVTKSNFGKWLFGDSGDSHPEARNSMIDIVEEPDKTKRRDMKDIWHSTYSDKTK